MFFFDLHCDTLTEAEEKGRGLMNDGLQLSIDRLPGQSWCQCFAIFMPDHLRGKAALMHFERNLRFFRAQLNLHAARMQAARTTQQMEDAIKAGKIAALLTVEGGSVLAGDIANVRKLAAAGVRILTLTWNGENELGGGQETEQGLSFFGRMSIAVLEQNGIVLDASHLSDLAFWDLAKAAKRPFIATHSNARAICDHKRNLTDRQFLKIVEIGGLVGLNFYPSLVSGREDASFDELARHIEHFLSLGGADTLAIGSDFDGARMPSWLSGVGQISAFYEKTTVRFGQEWTDKLFAENAMTFFRRYEALDLLLGALRE